jgi:O-antigen/teichoic acid export membrane protein
VVQRLFAIPAGLALVALLPLWPAYREAIGRSDLRWVRQTLRRSLVFVVAATVPLSIGLILAGPALVSTWTQGQLTPPPELFPALAASTVALAVAAVFQMLLNGAQAMRFQYAVWTVAVVLSIGLSIILTSLIGVSGPAIAAALVIGLVLVAPALVYVPRLLLRLESAEGHAPETAEPLPWAGPV